MIEYAYRDGRLDYLRIGAALAGWGLLAAFVISFQPGVVSWRVDALWAGAIVSWMLAVRRASGSLLAERPGAGGLLLPAAIIATVALYWLPFYDNWRWAYTGDSVAWYVTGDGAARNGLGQNLLSTHGVDDNFTYLHSLAFNALMFVFRPTLIWHRAGKLIVSCAGLAAIYTYFTMTLGRRWAAAIIVCAAVNQLWLWFSYISYGHIDSYIFYFLTLTFATLVWRHPDHLGSWALCGLIGGLSLFFTQTAWSAVALVGLFLGIYTLVTRRFAHAIVYAISFLTVAVPILMQFADLLNMTTRQARSIFQWWYLVRTFDTIVRLPYQSPYHHIGVNGAILRWPLGDLYVVGAGLAAIAVLPPLRRALRIPAIAPVLLALLLWDAVLMTLTNNGYGEPSTKRIFSLIPLQLALALVPAVVLDAWTAPWRWLRRAAAALTVVAIATYMVANIVLMARPDAGIYGVNVLDGLIELRQRFPERRVLLSATREGYAESLKPGGFYDESYELLDQATLETTITDDVVPRACANHQILCYEPNMDQERVQPMLERFKAVLQPFPLLNSVEMVCYDCVGQPDAGAP